jgi:hypothetical protein
MLAPVKQTSSQLRHRPTPGWRLSLLCIGVVSAGCGALERTGSGDPRVVLGDHDVVRVSRYGDAAAAYRCKEAVLDCTGGGGTITQQCSCSRSGLIVVQ